MHNVLEVETITDHKYEVYIRVNSNVVRFKVKASNDAIIALANRELEFESQRTQTEVIIGAHHNSMSMIKRGGYYQPFEANAATPGILNENEFVGLWISWYNKCMAVGFQGTDIPFVSYTEDNLHFIDRVSVRTAKGSTGSWKFEVSPVILHRPISDPIEGQLHWVPMKGGDAIPKDAVIGGFVGEVLYLVRVRTNDGWLPGQYLPSAKCAYYSDGESESTSDNFEMLCGYNLMWVRALIRPPNRFRVGNDADENDRSFFIGRAFMGHNLIPGLVSPVSKCYSSSWKSEEMVLGESLYKVLIYPKINADGDGSNEEFINTACRCRTNRKCMVCIYNN